MFIIQAEVMTIISRIRYNVQTRNILTSALIFDITEVLLRPIDTLDVFTTPNLLRRSIPGTVDGQR